MEEDKKEIVEKLTKVIKKTRAGQSIQNIVYTKEYGGTEVVHVMYIGYEKKIIVTGDSGIGIIRDVMKHL